MTEQKIFGMQQSRRMLGIIKNEGKNLGSQWELKKLAKEGTKQE